MFTTQIKFVIIFFVNIKNALTNIRLENSFIYFSYIIIPNDAFLIHLIEINETVEMEKHKSSHDNNTTYSNFGKWGLMGEKKKSETENRKMGKTKKKHKHTHDSTIIKKRE